MIKAVKISKKSLLLALVLSFLVTTLVYSKTSNYHLEPETQGWNCPGIPYDAGPGYFNAGLPYQSRVQTEIYGTCGEISNKLSLKELAGALKTWQFYADWAVWSLPLLVIGYLINNRYAHNRD